jgi:hypothetical protein
MRSKVSISQATGSGGEQIFGQGGPRSGFRALNGAALYPLRRKRDLAIRLPLLGPTPPHHLGVSRAAAEPPKTCRFYDISWRSSDARVGPYPVFY